MRVRYWVFWKTVKIVCASIRTIKLCNWLIFCLRMLGLQSRGNSGIFVPVPLRNYCIAKEIDRLGWKKCQISVYNPLKSLKSKEMAVISYKAGSNIIIGKTNGGIDMCGISEHWLYNHNLHFLGRLSSEYSFRLFVTMIC